MLFLWPVDWLSDRAFAKLSLDERTFQLVVRELDDLTRIQQALTDDGIRAREFTLGAIGGNVSVRVLVRCRQAQAQRLLSAFAELPGVTFVTDEALSDADG